MGYQPIYDGEFDIFIDDAAVDVIQFLESVTRHKLILTGWVTDGPAGGNPMATLRGTRRQFMGWLNSYYDEARTAFDWVEDNDTQTWANAMATFGFKFVA
jgi:hypothetical protein